MRFFALVLVAGVSVAGSAQPSHRLPVRMEWNVPPECAPASEIARLVDAQLGREAFVASDDAPLVVRGRIVHELARYRAHVQLSTRAGVSLGVRELESLTDECRALDESLVVMLAILLNVDEEDLPPDPRDAPQPPPPAPARDSGPALRLMAGLGTALGLLPRPALVPQIGAGSSAWPGFELAIELAFAWTWTAPLPLGEVLVNAAAARVLLLPTLLSGDVELALRVGAGAGSMWAQGFGFAPNHGDAYPLLELRAGMRLAIRIAGPLWFTASGDLALLLLRPTFVVHAGSMDISAFTPSPLTGELALALTLRSP